MYHFRSEAVELRGVTAAPDLEEKKIFFSLAFCVRAKCPDFRKTSLCLNGSEDVRSNQAGRWKYRF